MGLDVACLQLSYPEGENERTRIERMIGLLEDGPTPDLVVLPELWDVGYFAFDRYTVAARPLKEGPLRSLSEIARKRSIVLVAGSVIERRGDRLHNTVAVLGPDGGMLGTYRKVHLFGYGSRERELLMPGEGPVVVETPLGCLGVATCFDLRFPEQFSAMRHQGADVMVVPAAWPATRSDHWDVLQRARAIETQTPLVSCNGIGDCCGVELAGHSMIIGARGEVFADGGDETGWVCAAIDPEDTHHYRTEFPLRSEGRGMSELVEDSQYLSKSDDIAAKYIRAVEGQKTFGDVRTKAMRVGHQMVLLEIDYPPEAGAPLHVHQHETICYVVRGKVRVTVGDEVFVMEEGDACTHPQGVPHGIRGIEHARVLEIKSPAQSLSEFLRIADQ